MALLQIRRYGDAILRKTAKPVTRFDEGLHRLLDDMADTLNEYEGLGLAAPQVGKLRRIAIIRMEEGPLYELINPLIIEASGEQIKSEACLSVPNKQGDVKRPAYVKVEAYNRAGERFELEADDVTAVAVCHELDHLDGVVFLEKATNIRDRTADDD